MALHLVCGWKTSGKSTLCRKQLKNCTPYSESSLAKVCNGYYQIVYSNPKTLEIPSLEGLEEKSFAYNLKVETHKKLGIEIPLDIWDAVKDKMRIQRNGTTQTLREWYITFGLIFKEDPQYWAKVTLKEYQNEKWMIPDWRKPTEESYAKKIARINRVPFYTWRVYRSSAPIPTKDDPLEHDLDKEGTDYLCVQSIEDYNRALVHFPQYTNYLPKWIIY